VVAPYWAGGLDPRELVGPDARRVPIDLDNDPENLPDAFLYAAQSSARLRVATAWTAAAALALALALAALAWRDRRQQREIFTIASALAEKRRLLVRAERLALAGQVAANLLHDLRKPVNAIKALAEDALDDPGASSPADWESVRERTREFQGMLASARLERFVRAGDAEAEWCDLADILERSVNLLAHEQGEIQIERDWRARSPLVEANPWELIQVFSNLLLNAYQALGGKGRVALRLFETQENGGALVAEVEDDGPGLAPEIRSRLFEPFATTRPTEGGSGLGAYIAREIVNSLGGTVEAGGAGPLGGARFVVAFPSGRGPA
jgi:signal transduction histidine kinase